MYRDRLPVDVRKTIAELNVSVPLETAPLKSFGCSAGVLGLGSCDWKKMKQGNAENEAQPDRERFFHPSPLLFQLLLLQESAAKIGPVNLVVTIDAVKRGIEMRLAMTLGAQLSFVPSG